MKLSEILKPLLPNPIALIIKGSPDPDVIASSLAVLSYYEAIGGAGKIFYSSYISHSSNKAMVNILGIGMEKVDNFTNVNETFKHYIVLDHSDPCVQGLDLAKLRLHIDHHKEHEDKSLEDFNYVEMIELDAGASSTIVTRLLEKEDYFKSGGTDIERVATALAYGIRSDTDNLDSGNPKDWEAMRILAQYASKGDVRKMTKSRITAQTAHVLKKAYEVEKEEQGWLYAGIGFLQETYRDSIAIVADELMRRQGIEHVLVYAIIEKESGSLVIEGSVRSLDAGTDLAGFVKAFSENSGGRKHKAGFQIPVGFLSECPNKEALDNLVRQTIEAKFQSILSTEKGK